MLREREWARAEKGVNGRKILACCEKIPI